jgi:ABC-type transport system involved in Fe-S cluster assembly fused permease/ATPase subunit
VPTALRVTLILVIAGLFDLALFDVVALHAYAWIAIAMTALVVLSYGCFEIKRYQPHVDRTRASWRPTAETFIDPTTGTKTIVYYDSASGKRDYRATAERPR